ncbi:sensory rhodopsin transducer [Natronococcus pandeyae]|uniref:Sensory rhodopsin transducer n=1 Tax=Natronococcus pandeyae TaxID=2055836 RepID=A0A8J8Q4J8_9EURY|nr:sensory rhodopsin transducer [Natronococcus pandeyae]TYL38794.1 sensory rhodopsin transducer [Natronococcus pandeyae]
MTGKQTWAIPEGYIPEGSTGPEPEMTSHETVCILNTNDEDATVEITVYFTDREPIGPFERTVPAERTAHFRFNEFEDPEEIPKGEDFASVIESDVPVVCQHTRLDSRQAENALLTTIAHPGE